MGLFAKAAKKSETKKTKKKSTTWNVGQVEEEQSVALSLHELAKLNAERKAIDARMKLHKQVVFNSASDSFIADFAALGIMPDSPMQVVNNEGDKATYVVQDRSGQYGVKDEQIEAMKQLLGDDAVDELLYDETSIAFNREVMAIDGVSEVIEKYLESAIRKLTSTKNGDPVINEETASQLLDVSVKTALKPGTVDRAASLVGNNTVMLSQLIDAIGSSCVRYIKV